MIILKADKTLNLARSISPRPGVDGLWDRGSRAVSRRLLVPSMLLPQGKKGGVHNVHTLGFGLGRTSAEPARIAYVFWSSQCLQGLECGSSPTSGTADPLVEGDFCFNVCTKLVVASL